MNVTRLEPWSLMNMLQRNHEHFPQHLLSTKAGTEGGSDAQWRPAVDIIEEQDRFVLRADVPGVSADDIDINMEKNVLTVSGERRLESAAENESARRIERITGRFVRRFHLPDTAHAEEISARTANGILEVVIPKQADLQPRKISVQAA